MTRNREQINLVFLDIDWHGSISLNRIRVEPGIGWCHDLTDFMNWQMTADFIIDRHNRDQNRIGTNCPFQLCQINLTIFINIKVGNLIPLPFQIF